MDRLTLPTAAALLERLARGEPVTALGVRLSRSAEIARLARASGHDVIWVDLEHSAMPIDVAGQICATALDLGLVPLVRVPENDWGVIGRVLDAGALGIIAPRIESVEQARALAAACRFPPAGHRSAIASLAAAGYERMPAADMFEALNRATLVQVLIESPLGLKALEQIADVPGVDMVALGTNDLCAELGVAGQPRHPLVTEAIASAIATCRRLGKPIAVGGLADPAQVAETIRAGAVPWLMTAIDSELMLGALRERVQQSLASFSGPVRGASAR